jgi:predicted Zn-dependent protease with MMP-like domain
MSEPPPSLPTIVPATATAQPEASDDAYDPVAAWGPSYAPSIDDFAAIADAAYGELPDDFRNMVGDVVLHIFDFPEPEMLEDLGIEDPFELTGLYQGADLQRRSLFDTSPHQSMVFLFRRPILDEWLERGDVTLKDLVTHVMVHEIGHHFGLSDADMEAVDAQG